MGFKASYTFIGVDRITNVTKKIGDKVAKATDKFDKLNKKVEKTGRVMKSTGRAFNNSLRNMAAGVLGFVGIKKFIDVGADFQDSVAGIEAITEATGEKLKFFGDSALDLSKKWGISAAEIGVAIKDIASKKSELLDVPEDLIKVTNSAILLSKAAGITVPEAVKASIGALNQYGAGADKAAKFTEILAVGQKIGASEIGDTAMALKNVGSIAAKMGVGFGELNAAIQVLAKNELKAAEAGTGLRGTIAKMERLGGRFAPSQVGFIKALENIKDLNLNNTVVIKKFGLETLNTIVTLRANVPLLKRWTKEIGNGKDAMRQAEAQMNTFRGRLSILNAEFENKLIKTFMKMEKNGVFTKIMNDMSKWLGSIDTENLNGVADALTVILTIARGIDLAFRPIAALIKGFGTGLGEFAAAYSSNDFSVVTGLSDAFSFRGKLFGVYETEGQAQEKKRLKKYRELAERMKEKQIKAAQYQKLLFDEKTFSSLGDTEAIFNKVYSANDDLFKVSRLFAGDIANTLGQENIIGNRNSNVESNVVDLNIHVTGDTEKIKSIKTKSRGSKLNTKSNMVGP